MKKNSSKIDLNVSDKELDRDFVSLFLSPKYDGHIHLEDDSYFEKIYGKVNVAKMKEGRRNSASELKKR